LIEEEKILAERRNFEQQLSCSGLPIQGKKAVHLLQVGDSIFESVLAAGRR
jgi:hypothetical protein